MYKKISSIILFFVCLFSLSNVQAGSYDYLESVYHLLLRSKVGTGLSIEKTGSGTGVVNSDATINCGTECNEVFEESTDVTLTATPSAGSFFTGWSGDGCSGIAPTCVVQVNKTSSITVTAEFRLIPVLDVSLIGTGNGGSVTSAPAGIDCGLDCQETYNNFSTSVTLTANAPDADSYFAGWSGDRCSGILPCTITMDSPASVNAEYSLLPAFYTESESNDTYLSADVVTFDRPIDGSVDATSDKDWFAFNATGEDIVTIEFDFPGFDSDPNDWHIQLYSSNNPSTPLRDVYVNQVDTFNIETSGDITYYLVVSKDASHTITNYEFTIITGNSDPAEKEVPITGTNDHLNATPLPFDTVMHGNLTDIDADQDWYKLQTAGSTITTKIEFSTPYTTNSKDWVVTVYADNAGALGQMLARTAVTDGSVCYVTLPNTSTIFYVMVTDLTELANNFEGRPYTLTVYTGVGNVTGEIEPNNTSGTATSVDLSTDSLSGQLALSNVSGTLDVVNDEDWFVFQATSTTMSFQLTSPETGNATWTVSIISGVDGTTVMGTADIGNNGTLNVPGLTASDNYYVKVVPYLTTTDKVLVSAQYVIESI